jgi:hypothetical protein
MMHWTACGVVLEVVLADSIKYVGRAFRTEMIQLVEDYQPIVEECGFIDNAKLIRKIPPSRGAEPLEGK